MRNTLSIQARAERRKRTVLFVALGCLVFVSIALNFLAGDMGYVQYREYLENERSIAAEIARTETENRMLAGEVEALEQDREAVERLAREQLDMMRDGEVVFKFRTQ